MRVPKRLKKNPLIDAVAEVRFTSKIPPDTIVGMVYGQVKNDFGAPESLPILQIPAQLRESDPELRYQAHYRFRREGHILLLGPRNVALSTQPYVDWKSAEPKLIELLTKLSKVDLFDKIERIGLRYVNFFEGLNVLEQSTLKLEIAGKSIVREFITLRSEREEKDFKVITQIANLATVQGPPVQKGSIVDLDIVNEKITVEAGNVPESLMRFFGEANELADNAFFSLLKPDFIKSFEPEF